MSYSLRHRLVFGLSMMFSILAFPAANASIIVQLQGNQLQIMGDSQDNAVAIAANSDWVTITSTDTNPASVQSFPAIKVSRIIVGTMGGGDDIEMTSMLQPGFGNENAIKVDIHSGRGDDQIQINGYWGKTDVHSAAGSDEIELGSGASGAKFDGNLTVFAGQGSDSISFTGIAVGGRTKVHGGASADSVAMMNNNFVGLFRLSTGGGNDVVTFIDNRKGTNAPWILRGGAGNKDSLTGKFDLAEMNIAGFEQVTQLPDDPVLITAVDRATFARTSYSSTYGPPPDNVISELEENSLASDQVGPWDGSVNASILESYEVVAPIVASANQVSDVSVSGGTLDIDLFSDQYWGSQPSGHIPFGSARSSSQYEVTFVANEDLTLSVDGFLSTNRASAGYPLGFASFRVIERGQADVTLVQRVVTPVSDVLFNDLVETLDGTVVTLESGKTYSIVVATTGNSSATTSPRNSEAEVSLIWSIN